MKALADKFIHALNAFDVETALSFFARDAVIDDVSVGDAFAGVQGIRRYLEQYFVGYRTASKLLSLEQTGAFTAVARIDFTGDFGHEIGSLGMTVNADGLIERIDAHLE